MRKDPFAKDNPITQVGASQYFTDREGYIEAFQRYVEENATEPLRVLVFYGVGGIGKSTLLRKLAENVSSADPPLPHAQVNLENVAGQANAYRDVLLRLRSNLSMDFKVSFPRFDLCAAVMLAQEGGAPPPLVRANPSLHDAFRLAASMVGIPVANLGRLIERTASRYPGVEGFVRRAGGTEEVIALRNRMVAEDPTLAEELIRRFAEDLRENLPKRSSEPCRGILFIDTYEAMWVGREAGISTQARMLDWWVRSLAEYCLSSGVLLVVGGRDRLTWADDDSDWEEFLDQHLMGGLSAHDAQAFLSKCGIGDGPEKPPSPLQTSILSCCRESTGGADAARHPLFLALCAETVLNTRAVDGADPPPETFSQVPSQHIASELANRFLKSLHNHAMELWVTELSLTPRFDASAALALDVERQHHNGRAGWEQLIRFSFVDRQPDGYYRLHKTMREALATRVDEDDGTAVHQWFRNYWSSREEAALTWFHRWILEPEGALEDWDSEHKAALRQSRIPEARKLLTWWEEIPLDEGNRALVGDQLWARTHRTLATALVDTPCLLVAPAVTSAIQHYEAALRIFTEANFPRDWATTQVNLGNAYQSLPTGDRGENLRRSIACYEAALRVRTETGFPQDWATTQNNLGVAWEELPTGDRGANLQRSMACYEAALRVRTEADFPEDWAATQINLGNVFMILPTGDADENVRRGISCYEDGLRVYTEGDFPQAWATTQNNLACACQLLTTGDQGENLERAITCYESALRVRTEADFPQDWAMTQSNLGIAYQNLQTGDRDENLRRSMTCYEEALRIYTQADLPQDWAMMQNYLGDIWRNWPTGDRGENLRRAMTCYEAALQIYTEAEFPVDWAKTQNNLGDTYEALFQADGDAAHLHCARDAFAASMRGYQSAGMFQHDEEISGKLSRIDEVIATQSRGTSSQ